MIIVIERVPNFVDLGDDYERYDRIFDNMEQVFECELVQRWKDKLGDEFGHVCVNNHPDPTGVSVVECGMLAVYDKEDKVEIDPEDMNTFLEEQAQVYNQSKDDFISNLYNQNKMDVFMGILKTRKVVEFIINKNKEREKENG